MNIMDFFTEKKEKKETKMSRKVTVSYKMTDGKKPEGDTIIKLRTPITIDVGSSDTRRVDLGVKFDVPVLMFPSSTLERQGVKLMNSGIVDEGQSVSIWLEADAGGGMFEVGDVMALLVPVTSKVKLVQE